MTHPPLIAWSGGAHTSQAAQDELDKDGWRGWRVKWWARAKANGATTLIERFPGTRFGEEPNIAHVLRLVGTDFQSEARKITAAHSPGRSPTRVDLYLRPFTDLPMSTDQEWDESCHTVQEIADFARRCGVGVWVEDAGGDFQEWGVSILKHYWRYRGMEPSRPKTGRTGVPSIDTERRLLDAGIGIHGENWPSDAEPFNQPSAPRILVRTDDVPLTRARIEEIRGDWVPGCHMWQIAEGLTPG